MCTLRVVAKAAAGTSLESLRFATDVYFGVSVAVCALTAGLYTFGLRRMSLYKSCIEHAADLHKVRPYLSLEHFTDLPGDQLCIEHAVYRRVLPS